MTRTHVKAAEFVILLPLDIPLTPSWDRGPLPLENLPGTPYQITANQAGRQRYVPGQQIPHILWGSSQSPRRWNKVCNLHATFTSARGTAVEVKITGAELLRIHSGQKNNGIGVLHGACNSRDDQVLSTFVELSNIDKVHGLRMREFFAGPLSPAEIPSRSRRVRIMSLVCPTTHGLPEIAPNLDGIWTRKEQWLSYLATSHMPEGITVSRTLLDHLRRDKLEISDEWSCFSAAEGSAYVANDPATDNTHTQELLRQRVFRFHTIETDAFLLAEAQDLLLSRISDALFVARNQNSLKDSLESMKDALEAFRLMYWGERIAERGFTNSLLSAQRAVKDIPERLEELRADVREATNEIAERDTASSSAALGVLAVVGFPVSTALSIWAALGADRWPGLAIALILAAITSVALVLVFPGLRGLVGKLGKDGSGKDRRMIPGSSPAN